MQKRIDLTNQVFSRLTVISEAKKRGYLRYWNCECICGKLTIVYQQNLINNHTTSCGCYKQEIITKHKKHSHPLYSIWVSMKQRCLNIKNKAYFLYGGRGITICNEWINNFENFYQWAISNNWDKNLSIDRIDNNEGYYPKNCRWVTSTIQNRNKRKQKNTLYIGVEKVNKKWKASLTVNKKIIRLGRFTSPELAAKARDQYILDNNLIGFTLNFEEFI